MYTRTLVSSTQKKSSGPNSKTLVYLYTFVGITMYTFLYMNVIVKNESMYNQFNC